MALKVACVVLEGDMTVLEDVKKLIIQVSPQSICDDCITDRLELSVRQHANHKTRELAVRPDFDRRVDVCAICGKTKKVIRSR